MLISNNNYINPTDKVCNFRVEFRDTQRCKTLAKSIQLLTRDDHTLVWKNFQGKFAGTLLSHAIDGLMIFLSCQQKENVLTGQFASFDMEADGKLFSDYVNEFNEDAVIDINEKVIAA